MSNNDITSCNNCGLSISEDAAYIYSFDVCYQYYNDGFFTGVSVTDSEDMGSEQLIICKHCHNKYNNLDFNFLFGTARILAILGGNVALVGGIILGMVFMINDWTLDILVNHVVESFTSYPWLYLLPVIWIISIVAYFKLEPKIEENKDTYDFIRRTLRRYESSGLKSDRVWSTFLEYKNDPPCMAYKNLEVKYPQV